MMDTDALDDYLDSGKDPWKLLGKKVDWHGRTGTVVKVPSPAGKRLGGNYPGVRRRIGLRVRVALTCPQRCGRRMSLTVVSGLHRGAFCYVVDSEGKFLADLRDQVPTCTRHKG
jgi:hypothetical protein